MNGLPQIFISLCTLAAACFIYALIRSLGSQLRLRRLQASIRRQQPSSCCITSCDNRRAAFAAGMGCIILLLWIWIPTWPLRSMVTVLGLLITAAGVTLLQRIYSAQSITIRNHALLLTDWNGIACAVKDTDIRYVHFYAHRTLTGLEEWGPRITIYSSRQAHRLEHLSSQASLVLVEHSRGHEGIEFINHMHISIQNYVILRTYFAQHGIAVRDDYASSLSFPTETLFSQK